MAQNILTDYLLLINYLISRQERLLEYHFKAEALLEALLNSNLAFCSTAALHDYLWILNDIISQAKILNESLLNRLMKLKKLGQTR